MQHIWASSGDSVKHKRLAIWCLGLILLVCLAGCRSSDQGSAQYLFREAVVETVEVEFIGVGPLIVNAIVKGTVPEDCAKVDEIRQEFDEATRSFSLTIAIRRPVEETCVQRETPFEATIPLAVDEVPDGLYTVVANGVTATFRLERFVEAPPE